jgi:hypothetical protein
MRNSNGKNEKAITELNIQHTALLAEQEALAVEIPELDANWRSSPTVYSNIGNVIGSPESRAAMEALSSAKARARAIPKELEKIQQKTAHLERVARIETVKAESKQIMANSTDAIEIFERKQSRLNDSIDTLQKESEQVLEKARQVQKNAEDLYAASVSSGDSAAAKAALAEVQKSSKSLAAAGDQSEQQGGLITALQTELAAVETQIITAQQEKDSARNALLGALELETEEEWNALTEQMSAVGARKIAIMLARFGYGYSDGLSDLEIPRFGPSSFSVGHRELTELASKYSVADLLAK